MVERTISLHRISIHASAREATLTSELLTNHYIYFNPRLREGGDPFEFKGSGILVISIHASAREATDADVSLPGTAYISIHASAREATALSCRLCRTHRYFNPRLREGGDCPLEFQQCHNRISIHASAREATSTSGCPSGSESFQSTPPRGRRPTSGTFAPSNFTISIHASAREATALITNFYI